MGRTRRRSSPMLCTRRAHQGVGPCTHRRAAQLSCSLSAVLKRRVPAAWHHLCHPAGAQARQIAVQANPFQAFFDKVAGQQQQNAPGSPDEEENTMVRLEEDSNVGLDGSEEAFGPGAILLVGFMAEEVDGFRDMMQSMGADMFKIIPATRAMMDGPLEAALHAEPPEWEQPALGTRRVIVLSGMFGGEIIEVVSAYRESDLPPAVFAAAVPNNMGRQVKELVAEVTAEDSAMRRLAAEREAAQQQEQQ